MSRMFFSRIFDKIRAPQTLFLENQPESRESMTPWFLHVYFQRMSDSYINFV